jgi:hypothetical protein
MSELLPAEKQVARWIDRSDKTWPVEVVPAWEYDRQAKEIEQLRTDAARYRWLRDHIAQTIIGRVRREGESLTMDELIDKRMRPAADVSVTTTENT